MRSNGYAACAAGAHLAPYDFERHELRPNDVAMEILYCVVCHSDLHNARNDWDGATYPMVPGHENIGRVTTVGPEVILLDPIRALLDDGRPCDGLTLALAA